jgi:hypothetical protein
MKFAQARPYADPEAAARKLIEIAKSVKTIQDGRIYIEEISGPFLNEGTAAEFKAGLDLAIAHGWLDMHESGTFVRFTRRGAELFRVTTCALCQDCGWVCETHPANPWEGPHACPCGAPGAPCPACNAANGAEAPRLPDGFKTDVDKKGWRH